jgi:hypothetical protein
MAIRPYSFQNEYIVADFRIDETQKYWGEVCREIM